MLICEFWVFPRQCIVGLRAALRYISTSGFLTGDQLMRRAECKHERRRFIGTFCDANVTKTLPCVNINLEISLFTGKFDTNCRTCENEQSRELNHDVKLLSLHYT